MTPKKSRIIAFVLFILTIAWACFCGGALKEIKVNPKLPLFGLGFWGGWA